MPDSMSNLPEMDGNGKRLPFRSFGGPSRFIVYGLGNEPSVALAFLNTYLPKQGINAKCSRFLPPHTQLLNLTSYLAKEFFRSQLQTTHKNIGKKNNLTERETKVDKYLSGNYELQVVQLHIVVPNKYKTLLAQGTIEIVSHMSLTQTTPPTLI